MHANEPSSASDKRFQKQLQFKLTALRHNKRNNARQNVKAL